MAFSPEQSVTAIEVIGGVADIGKERSMAIPSHYRFRYIQEVKYTLADGSVFQSRLQAKTKPQLAEKIEHTKRTIAANCVTAKQWTAEGEESYWSTTTAMSMDQVRSL